MTLAERRSFVQLLVCLTLGLLPCCGLPPTAADEAAPGQTTPIVFTPDDVLRADVEAAAERWSAATGRDILVGEGGTPVQVVSSIPRGDGSEAPGATKADLSMVEINTRARGAQRTRSVLHEMGHALGAAHIQTHGIMSITAPYDPVIDALSLEEVCSHLECTAFIPEVP